MCGVITARVLEHHRHAPGEEIGHHRAGALVGDVHHVDAGHLLHQLAAEVLRGAGAGGGVVVLARARLQQRDQLAEALRREVGMHDEYIGSTRDQADGREVGLFVG
jgi:hypothetical protein